MNSKVLQIFLLLISCLGISQNETTNWYTLGPVGLNISATGTSTLPGLNAAPGQIAIKKVGSASISDAAGNLLLYTYGKEVWNGAGMVVQNGDSVSGALPYATKPIIIKKPLSSTEYYIFSEKGFNNGVGENGLRYSVVDISLANGQGSVTAKNVVLDTTAHCYKIAATNHCNNTDVWILVHELNTNRFLAFLLTSAGVLSNPVISSIGLVGTGSSINDMKFSPNGRKIGNAAMYNFELYDFDRASGVVSNRVVLPSLQFAGGCEFSPDGTKFYGCSDLIGNGIGSMLYQWDLCASANAPTLTYSINLQEEGLHNMQIAPDGKIYIGGAHSLQSGGIMWMNGIGIIQAPNLQGAQCNYIFNNSNLFFCNSYALPAFNSSYFYTQSSPTQYSITVSKLCQTVQFTPVLSVAPFGCIASGAGPTSVIWNFGDPASQIANTSTDIQATHKFSALGNYTVTALAARDCTTDTLKIPVVISDLDPAVGISAAGTICKGSAAVLTATGASTYSWSNAVTTSTQSIVLTNALVIFVNGTNTVNGCKSSASATVNVQVCSGLETVSSLHEIKVYPNPAQSILYIEYSNNTSEALYFDILSIDGRVQRTLIPEIDTAKQTLAVATEELESGLYILRIKNKQQVLQSKTVVIE